ncbi:MULTISPECIES: OmpH family outer membrane protein [unclassified Brevundimonas]|uniref:OmpH family outer membrane protein n=1 Tax=unclassified Brevundimonas TaxID=2622653 RepID=UPI0025C201EB|nr:MULTISPECIES: OmpH family outer membrane protein [unclassified Brevundimonas]
MMIRTLTFAALVAATALPAAAQTIGGSGQSQSQQSQPQSQSLGGPLIPGVCLLSREAVFANAAVGRAASARLQELTQAAQTEVDSQRAPIEADAQAFEREAAGLSEARRDERRQALAQRIQVLQQQAAHNSREIEATRAKVLEQIANAAQPVIAQVYASKACGLLFDRATALGGNFGNDLTAEVVAALDARMSTIAFDRERLPQS